MNDAQLTVLVAVGFERGTLAEQIPMVSWVGGTGVQFWVNYDVAPEPEEWRRQAADAGLAVRALHAPYGVGYDFSSPLTSERAQAVDRMLPALDLLAAVAAGVGGRGPGAARSDPSDLSDPSDRSDAPDPGPPFLVLHPAANSDSGMSRKERRTAMRRVAESLVALLPAAEERGLRLALENMPPTIAGYRIDDLIEIVTTVASPTLGLCFDTGHAHMVGKAAKMWAKAAPHVIAMHAHDNRRRDDDHLPPLEGSLNWKALHREMTKAEYRGDFAL